MKGNINMEKQKRITLNADKRKVIADVFQDHFESNSKFKKSWTEAKETYNNLREQAKVKINELPSFRISLFSSRTSEKIKSSNTLFKSVSFKTA